MVRNFMWIYQDDLENGVDGLPKISKTTQANARKNGLLEYLKIGRHIVYKKDWINNYLKSNTRNSNDKLLQPEKDAHAS